MQHQPTKVRYGYTIACHYGESNNWETEMEDQKGDFESLSVCQQEGKARLAELEKRDALLEVTYSLQFYHMLGGCYEHILSIP